MPFKVGDRVRIVNYGHYILMDPITAQSTEFPQIRPGVHDMKPDLINQEGIVEKVSEIMWGDEKFRRYYSVKGPSKYGPYEEDQLQLITDHE